MWQVDTAFARRLLATSVGGKKLLEAACKGRLIGLHLAAEGCLAELANSARGWNSQTHCGPAVLASASVLECAHLCQTFFENGDSGQAIH